MSGVFHTQMTDEQMMIVRFNRTDHAANTFTWAALEELDELVKSIEYGTQTPRAVIFTSGKEGVFINGADLFEMRQMGSAQKQRFINNGQRLFDRIARLPMVTMRP